jgi:hypothetical protein
MESPLTRTRRDPAGVYSRLEVDPADTDDLLRRCSDHGLDVPLVILDSPYREISRPALDG